MLQLSDGIALSPLLSARLQTPVQSDRTFKKIMFLLLMVAPFLTLLLCHLNSPCSNFKSCIPLLFFCISTIFPSIVGVFHVVFGHWRGHPACYPAVTVKTDSPVENSRLFFCYREENGLTRAPSGKARAWHAGAAYPWRANVSECQEFGTFWCPLKTVRTWFFSSSAHCWQTWVNDGAAASVPSLLQQLQTTLCLFTEALSFLLASISNERMP